MFAKNLKKIMQEKSVTISQLARVTGFSKGSVSAWVNGQYEPTPERMAAIAGALGVDVAELAGEHEPAQQAHAVPLPIKVTLTCKEAATLLHKHESYVRKGLQQGRPGFEYGSAVKTSGKWSYCILAGKFTEVTGIPVNAT